MTGKYMTRVSYRTASTASAGGGAVTRTNAEVATVFVGIIERDAAIVQRGVPVAATSYDIVVRKPIVTLAGTTITPSIDDELVTVDESTARTFSVAAVRGHESRSRQYVLRCNRASE